MTRHCLLALFLLFPLPSLATDLVLLLAVDQLMAERVTDQLPGGLGRMVREGYVFTDATLDHGLTNTCPGHVVISTGVNPARAGIPGNSYIDHETLAERYCVDDNDAAYTVRGGSEIRSPRAITASTLGDWLKAAVPGARVFSVSGKDRAAITLGGHGADGVFWFHGASNQFTTSGYYPATPAYLDEFNGNNLFVDGAGKGLPENWEHGEGSFREDDFVGESEDGNRFSPHPLNQGEPTGIAGQVYRSPYIDQLTGELARRVVVAEELGQRGVTDLLAVSFSATDTVGHRYGPFSAESEDTLARLDAELGKLFDLLEERDITYVAALTADHGVMPLPEYLEREGVALNCPVEGNRISRSELTWLMVSAWWEFTFPFGDPTELIGMSSAGLAVSEEVAASHGTSKAEVLAWLEAQFEAKPYVVEVWTPDEIAAGEGEVARLYRNSRVEGKSGDLTLQLAEHCLFGDSGTTHGSPYRYDRHIPLIFFGEGVRQQRSDTPAHSLDISPTLAEHLGLEVPETVAGIKRAVWSDRSPSRFRAYRSDSIRAP